MILAALALPTTRWAVRFGLRTPRSRRRVRSSTVRACAHFAAASSGPGPCQRVGCGAETCCPGKRDPQPNLTMRKRSRMPKAAFVCAASVMTAGVLVAGCSLIVPHFGELRVEPIGGVIYTYPVPAVVVTNLTLPRSSGVRHQSTNVYARLHLVAFPAQKLQVVVRNLPPVETGALVRAEGVMPVALGNDAVKLEILRRAACQANAAEFLAQPVERLSSPNLRASTH